MLINEPFVVAVTGPESSGKTTLANALSGHLSAPCAPEFARYFTAGLGRPYVRADLEYIGRGQKAWETWYGARANRLLILDTDWTVLQIWESFRFPEIPRPYWKRGYGQPVAADLYVLNAPDFPWQHDPLRENPADQQALFDLYEKLLQSTTAPYLIASGPPEARVKQLIAALREISPSLSPD